VLLGWTDICTLVTTQNDTEREVPDDGSSFLHNTHLHVTERKSRPLCNTNIDDARTVVVIWVKRGNAAFLNE